MSDSGFSNAYRTIGWILLIGGLACLGYFLFVFRVTEVFFAPVDAMGEIDLDGKLVDVGGDYDPAKGATRQIGVFIGVVAAFAGLLLIMFAKSQERDS